jgi:hypothetical protein
LVGGGIAPEGEVKRRVEERVGEAMNLEDKFCMFVCVDTEWKW